MNKTDYVSVTKVALQMNGNDQTYFNSSSDELINCGSLVQTNQHHRLIWTFKPFCQTLLACSRLDSTKVRWYYLKLYVKIIITTSFIWWSCDDAVGSRCSTILKSIRRQRSDTALQCDANVLLLRMRVTLELYNRSHRRLTEIAFNQ